MMGGMFAGTEEAPGEIVLFQGRSYKSYRGMGSIGAMQQGQCRPLFSRSSTGSPNADKLVPEGIEGRVPYKGLVVAIITSKAGGLRAAWATAAAPPSTRCAQGRVREITAAGIRESHVHDVQITRKRRTTAPTDRRPNYFRGEGLIADCPVQPPCPRRSSSLDFGSQVTQLIARRVREAHVYCEVHPATDRRLGANTPPTAGP